MQRTCPHCRDLITCSSCRGSGAPGSERIGSLVAYPPHCFMCDGLGVLRNHACADVYDRFEGSDELAQLDTFLAHPDIALPSRRDVRIRLIPGTWVPADARMNPVFGHHAFPIASTAGRRLEGIDKVSPFDRTDTVFFNTLCAAELIYSQRTEQRLSLSCDVDFDGYRTRAHTALTDILRVTSTVTLHRIFSGLALGC